MHPLAATIPETPALSRVLGEGHSRIGTGDVEFRADRGQLVAFVSVAKFGGPDSPPIRGLLGALATKKKVTFLATLEDGRKFLATANQKVYQTILGAAI